MIPLYFQGIRKRSLIVNLFLVKSRIPLKIVVFLYILLLAGINLSQAAEITLQWDQNPDADHYIIYWDTTSQTAASPRSYANNTGQINGNLTSYTINTLTNDTTYFAIKAFNSCGNSSDFSTEIAKSGTVTLPGNNPPVLNSVGPKSISENGLLEFTVSASDPDGNTLSYSAEGLPPGATLSSSTGLFRWTPGSSAAGSYQVTFAATDNGTPVLTDTEAVTITVSDVSTGTMNVTLQWDLNPDASYYIIYWDTTSQSGSTPRNYTSNSGQIDGGASNYTISSLPEQTTYFAIKAFNSCGNAYDLGEAVIFQRKFQKAVP